MEYITRKRFDKVIKNKEIINLEELVNVIESEFGYVVHLEEKSKDDYTERQKRTMTKAIFNNQDVLKQLHESSFQLDNEYIEDEEEFIKLIHEARENDGRL